MQEDLNIVISVVNGFICKLNFWNCMSTPYVATTVLRTKSSRNGQRILQHHKLFDGVHADDNLIIEWSNKIEKAISKNRSEEYRDWHRSSSLSTPIDADQIRSMINS